MFVHQLEYFLLTKKGEQRSARQAEKSCTRDRTDEELQVCLTDFNSSIFNIKARNDKREEERLTSKKRKGRPTIKLSGRISVPNPLATSQTTQPINEGTPNPLIVISPSCWDDPDDQQTPSITADSENSSVIEIENNQSSSTQRKSDVIKKDNNFIYKYLISSVDNVKPNKINYKCSWCNQSWSKEPGTEF